MNEFLEMKLSVNGFQTDILSGILYSEGCLGIHEITEERWQIYFNNSWTPDREEKLLVKLKAINPQFDERNFVISKVPFQEWNKEWKKYFKPIEPVDGIWIRPPWEKLPAEADGIEIIIDPQMAFGTGNHRAYDTIDE
jgi:ribosomal protein L11 methylase PrmA